jgi:hypothetical protein
MTEAVPSPPWSVRFSAPRGVFAQYGIAFLAIAVALALRLALTSELAGQASYLFFSQPY